MCWDSPSENLVFDYQRCQVPLMSPFFSLKRSSVHGILKSVPMLLFAALWGCPCGSVIQSNHAYDHTASLNSSTEFLSQFFFFLDCGSCSNSRLYLFENCIAECKVQRTGCYDHDNVHKNFLCTLRFRYLHLCHGPYIDTSAVDITTRQYRKGFKGIGHIWLS